MVSNIGRNVAPDPWHDFGVSGSKAAGAAWINTTAIDMTQYDSLLLELEPGDAFTKSEVELTICAPAGESAITSAEIEWVNIDREGFSVLSEANPEKALADGVKVIWSVGVSEGAPMLGLDSVFIHIKNAAVGAKEMDGIRYRRVGFRPSG